MVHHPEDLASLCGPRLPALWSLQGFTLLLWNLKLAFWPMLFPLQKQTPLVSRIAPTQTKARSYRTLSLASGARDRPLHRAAATLPKAAHAGTASPFATPATTQPGHGLDCSRCSQVLLWATFRLKACRDRRRSSSFKHVKVLLLYTLIPFIAQS